MIAHQLSQQFSIEVSTVRKLLCHILQCTLAELLTYQYQLTNGEFVKFHNAITMHQNGTPFEYITQTCNFCDIDLLVNESVLIPRTETELLVEHCTDYIIKHFQNRKCTILDLCTGSGAIAIAISKALQKHNIEYHTLAVDVSAPALKVCLHNIHKHNVNVEIANLNILQHFPQGGFDIIVSNPPYIETSTIPTLAHSVKNFEPHLALDGGEDGLIFYRRFAQILKQPICRSMFLCEIGHNQGNVMHTIFQNFNHHIIQDLNSQDRFCQILF